MLPVYGGLFRYGGTGKHEDWLLHDLENRAEIKESQSKFGFAVYVFMAVTSVFVIVGCSHCTRLGGLSLNIL